MKRNVLFAISLAFFGLMAGCFPGGPEFVDQLDVVYTDYDEEFNFTNSLTYSLPDGVIEITDKDPGNNPPEFIDEVFSDAILDRIRQNMTAYGFTEVDEDNDPDIIFLASAMSNDFYYFYNPCYWCWYNPGWGPGYGWGYPWYPGYVSGYTTGTLFLQMVNPAEIAGEEIPVVWTGVVNGLLQGSDASIVQRINVTVDRAFSQSTYLDK